MAQVVFVTADFIAEYPEFTGLTDPRAQSMFNIAQQSLLDNSDNSPVMDLPYRTQLFYMLVAHLLTIFKISPATGAGNSTPPGRISSATEGTVSSSFEYQVPQGSAMMAWYLQTQYGAMFWTATAQFRSMLYYASGASGIGSARAYSSAPFNVPAGIIVAP